MSGGRRALWGAAMAALSCVFAGGAIVALRIVVAEVDALAVNGLRFMGGAVLTAALAWFSLGRGFRVRRRDLGPVLGLSLIQHVLVAWLTAAAMAYMPAARGGLVMALTPVLTLALAVLWRRELLTLLKAAGTGLAVAGVAAVMVGDDLAGGAETWKGDVLMFLAAVFGAVNTVLAGLYLRHNRALAVAGVQLPAAAAVIVALVVARGDAAAMFAFSAAGWLAMAYLIVGGGVLMFLLWAMALERTTPSRAAITLPLNPIAAATFGALILGEPLTWRLLVGLAFVAAGIALVNWPERAARR